METETNSRDYSTDVEVAKAQEYDRRANKLWTRLSFSAKLKHKHTHTHSLGVCLHLKSLAGLLVRWMLFGVRILLCAVWQPCREVRCGVMLVCLAGRV